MPLPSDLPYAPLSSPHEPPLPAGRGKHRTELHMENHSWPLKKRLPEGCQPFTKADPLNHLAEASDDDKSYSFMPKNLQKLLKSKYEPNKYILIPQTKI